MDVQGKLIAKYAKHIEDDSVLELLHEIKPEIVEKVLIMPTIERVEKQMELKGKVGPTHLLRFMKKNVNAIQFDSDGVFFSPTNDSAIPVMVFAFGKIGHLVGWTGYISGRADVVNPPEIADGEYKIADLTLKHPAFRYLAFGDGVLCINTMQALMNIKKALVARQESTEISIQELLVAR
jgi:hypothetical protein